MAASVGLPLFVGTALVPPQEHRRLQNESSQACGLGNGGGSGLGRAGSLRDARGGGGSGSAGHVFDAQGRRRFHGAFTGGYSAGYFNTVGSAEGWTPTQSFSSSRDRLHGPQARQQRPEDFMDDEDDANLSNAFHAAQGYGESVVLRESKGEGEEAEFAFAGLRTSRVSPSSASASASAASRGDALDGLGAVLPSGGSAGVKMLEAFGWRRGEGIGPLVDSKPALDVAPFVVRDQGLNGLGYKEVHSSDSYRTTQAEIRRVQVQSDDGYMDETMGCQSGYGRELKSMMASRISEANHLEERAERGEPFAGYRLAAHATLCIAKAYPLEIDMSRYDSDQQEPKVIGANERARLSKLAAGSDRSLASRFTESSMDGADKLLKSSASATALTAVRTVQRWQPEKLLCKRLGVSVPSFSKTESKPITSKAEPAKPLLAGLVGVQAQDDVAERQFEEQPQTALTPQASSDELYKSIFEPAASDRRAALSAQAKQQNPPARIMFRSKFARISNSDEANKPTKRKARPESLFENPISNAVGEDEEQEEELDDTLPAWAQTKPKRRKKKEKKKKQRKLK